MKKRLVLCLATLFLSTAFYSCAPSLYHQIYDIESSQEGNTSDNTYNDGRCNIQYDFWKEKGKIDFIIENLTNDYLYIDLSKCFFVRNNFAYDYINQCGATLKIGGCPAVSAIICLPAKTKRSITCDYPIYDDIYRDCDLKLYPKTKRIWDKESGKYVLEAPAPALFTLDNSPIVFSNIVTYYTDSPDKSVSAVSTFFVAKIANRSDNEVTSSSYSYEFCDYKATRYGHFFNNVTPLRFYNSYGTGMSTYNGH